MKASRRGFLAGAGAAFAAAPALGHTPYRQWVVYRRKHLLVGAHRGDGRTYELAKAVVGALETELPEARARVARGPRPQRIAALLATGQIFLAVLSAEEALAMAEAAAPFEDNPPIPLQTLASLAPGYLLLATPDFPGDHASLVIEALHHAAIAAPPEATAINPHQAASAYWRQQLR